MRNNKDVDDNAHEICDKRSNKNLSVFILGGLVMVVLIVVQLGVRGLRAKTRNNNLTIIEDKYEDANLTANLRAPVIKKELLKEPTHQPEVSVKEKINETLIKLRAMKARQTTLKESVMTRLSGESSAKDKINSASPTLNIGVGFKGSEGTKSTSSSNSQNPNIQYLNQVSKLPKMSEATQIEGLDKKILQGKIIRGVTESAINSDLPALVRGHVTEDVYAEDGERILISNGSRLIGQYRSGGLRNGDTRVFIVWTRVISPDGVSVDIGSAGSDELGEAGMTGNVDNHYLKRFGSATLMTIISAGTANMGVNSNDQYNSKAVYRQALSQSFANSANQEFAQNASIKPTIRIPQGTPISIIVNKDISFDSVVSQHTSRSW